MDSLIIVVEKEGRYDSFTLNFWKSFKVEELHNYSLTTYSLLDEYTDDFSFLDKRSQDVDYLRFISYLGIDTGQEGWFGRCGQVISEEDIQTVDRYGDECWISIYKFYWLDQQADGDILNILSFHPVSFYTLGT